MQGRYSFNAAFANEATLLCRGRPNIADLLESRDAAEETEKADEEHYIKG